jgi:hypothetical protein
MEINKDKIREALALFLHDNDIEQELEILQQIKGPKESVTQLLMMGLAQRIYEEENQHKMNGLANFLGVCDS